MGSNCYIGILILLTFQIRCPDFEPRSLSTLKYDFDCLLKKSNYGFFVFQEAEIPLKQIQMLNSIRMIKHILWKANLDSCLYFIRSVWMFNSAVQTMVNQLFRQPPKLFSTKEVFLTLISKQFNAKMPNIVFFWPTFNFVCGWLSAIFPHFLTLKI